MAKCKCGARPKIISNVVQSMEHSGCCRDVCVNPIIADPKMLSVMTPLIYDEIGINLCTTFALGEDISTTYPTATNATAQIISAAYTYGDGNVEVEALAGRPNCYAVTLSNITLQFAVNLYDCCCRLLGTIYPTAVYLPSSTTAPTYDEDTNPTSVTLELFAPYGVSYDTTGMTPTPIINYLGFSAANNMIRQGINLFGMAKLLDFSIEDDTVTVGVTLVLQSLYYAGYRVRSEGKIDIPKGSIITPENSDCMRFVAGDLLNLQIKPLSIGNPCNEQELKEDCDTGGCGINSAEDDTISIT